MPELSGNLPDINMYDRIFIGTPVWNNDIANPVMSYLEQTDFAHKTVAPFWTYITNQGQTEKSFSKNIKNGVVVDGLDIRSANSIDDTELDTLLKKWANTVIPQ